MWCNLTREILVPLEIRIGIWIFMHHPSPEKWGAGVRVMKPPEFLWSCQFREVNGADTGYGETKSNNRKEGGLVLINNTFQK